ncbi:MAG: hypothetical protein SP1CHLAM54_07530 [Chlamydiia bacterium]|nr:hypothetical protein [Chlamydiia bacterium]MCH9615659.1 hypothetical protein [Chlamydiia bacterium]MCH9628938.1 hypothetical protein [Chlamydiia bacterium]
MNNYFIEKIFEKNRSMQSREALLNLYYLLRETLPVPGDVIELGCYRGLTAVLLRQTLDQAGSNKDLFVYDSFEGLSQKVGEDMVYSREGMRSCDFQDNQRVKEGFFKTSQDELTSNFKTFDAKLPQICSGWVQETIPRDLPDSLSFIHLDLDLYAPCLHVLTNILPRLSSGGVIVIDDYSDITRHGHQNAYPGVKAACDEVFKKPLDLLSAGSYNYQAIYRKP